VFFTVSLPLAARGILAGAILAFSRALGEFGATIMVAGNIPGETQTMSLAIFQLVSIGRDPDAYRLALVSVVVAFIAIWLSERLVRRSRAQFPEAS
jgi:molybdate transport system permease protein